MIRDHEGAAGRGADSGPGLQVSALTVRIPGAHGGRPVVDGVSFSVRRGEILALVGESGSGKTLTGLAISGLAAGIGAVIAPESVVQGGLGRAGMVFQDAAAAINPVRTLGGQLREVLSERDARDAREGGVTGSLTERALAALNEVGLPEPEKLLGAWPHQLSLGMLQRVQLALTLAAGPDVLVADEPTSALDPVLEEQILALLVGVTRARGLATILITHDLGAAARVSDRVAVMYAGRIMESGRAARVLATPAHPCTRALHSAMPDRVPRGQPIPVLPGRMPEPVQRDEGCPFRDRCTSAETSCRERVEMRSVPVGATGEKGSGEGGPEGIRADASHQARCVLVPGGGGYDPQ